MFRGVVVYSEMMTKSQSKIGIIHKGLSYPLEFTVEFLNIGSNHVL